MIFFSDKKFPISILWPDRTIYEEIPAFLPTGKYVFYTDTFDFDETYSPIIVRKSSGYGKDLSKKEDFLEVFVSIKENVFLTDEQKESLLKKEDKEFWKLIKLLTVTPLTKKFYKNREYISSYALFEHIFKGYGKTYKIYREMGVPHEVAMSSLISMFTSCLMEDKNLDVKYNPWFSNLVKSQRKYFTNFQMALLSYARSDRREIDFFTFLLEIYPY